MFGHDAIHDYAEARLAVGPAPRARQTLNVELVMLYWSSAA